MIDCPVVYDSRLAPWLLEPLLASILFIIATVGYLRWRRRSISLALDVDDHSADLEANTAAVESPATMERSPGKAYLQTLLMRALLFYAVMIFLLLIVVAAGSPLEYANDYYLLSTSIVAVAWFIVYLYFGVWCGSGVYYDRVLMGFWTCSMVIDALLVCTRLQMVVRPSTCDPAIFDGEPVMVDLVLIALRLLLTLWVVVVSVRYRGLGHHSYASLPLSSDSARAKSTFSGFFSKIYRLFPFVWPRGHPGLQLLFVACVLLLVAGRFINLWLPMQYKRIVDSLTVSPGNPAPLIFPLSQVLLFVLFRFLQGGNGLAQTVQSTLWIPIEQYTTREVSLDVFKHLHALSLRWHLNRKTGEVLRVLDRGTQAITSLLSYICFSIVPVLIDIVIAVIYFVVQFDITFGLTVLGTMIAYLIATVWVTEWRTKYRRTMIDMDNKTNAKAVDSLLNFETVKYYGNEDFELRNYRDAIVSYQSADWLSQLSLKFLNSIQNVIITIGLLIGSLLCVDRVVKGSLGVGDFVLFITYLTQLYVPLNFFGTYYRMINQNFIDMEKMLDLMGESAEVVDIPGALPLDVKKGHVVFENVSFTYEMDKATRPNIHNISFEIPPGRTVALCGPTGSGKSTICRLLFRSYDIQSGRILIDGQDIKTVTQHSLRKSIGVVPQDTVLFNDTLIYNVGYGRVGSADDEIIGATKLAQMHEKILTFPEKYETQVGERGLRLSGGEKQRIAIARTILKDPKIVLLDEATSALDSNTETLIQNALTKMTKERTTLIVAHRLSTIVHADMILVIKDGEIFERGTHEQLLKKKDGLYHEMWFKQKESTSE